MVRRIARAETTLIAWHNAFNRLQRRYERKEDVIHAFFDLADAIITVGSLIRQARTLYRWDTRTSYSYSVPVAHEIGVSSKMPSCTHTRSVYVTPSFTL